MFDSDRSGSVEYQKGLKTVFDAALEAVASGDKYEVVKIDKTGHRIVLRTSLGITSWGEDIALELSSISPRRTLVRVTSSYRRNVDPKTQFRDRNTKNVNDVLSHLSDYFDSESLEPDESIPTKEPKTRLGATKESSSSDLEFTKFSERSAAVFVGLVLITVISIAFFTGALRGQTSADTPRDISPSESKPPKQQASSAPSQPQKQQASSTSCSDSKTAVTMVRNIFADGSATISQVSLILDEAAIMWAQDATTAAGSKRDWLLKMNELAISVSSYLLTGAPEDGPTKLDQLFANMALTSSFCP